MAVLTGRDENGPACGKAMVGSRGSWRTMGAACAVWAVGRSGRTIRFATLAVVLSEDVSHYE